MIETFKILPHSCVPYYRSLLKIHEESEKKRISDAERQKPISKKKTFN